MPPGKHDINGSQDGKPVKKTVVVDAAAAERLQREFRMMFAAAQKGEGDRPYFDFNHDDGPASAWPIEFFWGGDDPQTGGVRAKLEWSGLGKEALAHKTFRRFSPSFFVDAKGEVTGAPVNMGGLVNRAAFRKIAPIWTKQGAESPTQEPTQEDTPMKSLLAILAKAGFVADANVDEATAITQFQAKATEVSNSVAELALLRPKLAMAEADLIKAKKAHATDVVERAALEGRIPPKDDAVKARWIGLIEADPANASLLPEPNPALRTVVKGAGANAGGPAVAAKEGAENAEHPFLAKAREIATAEKLSEADAVIKCGQLNPKLYEEYRQALFGAPAAQQ